jgi:hypothetical protein
MAVDRYPNQLLVAQKSTFKEFIAIPNASAAEFIFKSILPVSTLGLFVALVGFIVYSRWKYANLFKALQQERYRVENLEQRLSEALATIRKWEANPDLIHSRDCNLDYIRMRMEEQLFRNTLINQAKVKVKQFVSTALRINLSKNANSGIASRHGFQIDETFDITYERDIQGQRTRRVLFRIQIKLMKLPTQSTSSTIEQIVNCVETFLSPTEKHLNWQPAIQGHIVSMSWNQQAKPTPLLLLEQHGGGVNVSFRTKVAKKYRTLTGRNNLT